MMPLISSDLKNTHVGVPVVAQWLTNPTRNHEVEGSVPALAQWVKDLELQPVGAECLACHLCREDCLFSIAHAAGVWQQLDVRVRG